MNKSRVLDSPAAAKAQRTTAKASHAAHLGVNNSGGIVKKSKAVAGRASAAAQEAAGAAQEAAANAANAAKGAAANAATTVQKVSMHVGHSLSCCQKISSH